MLHPETLVRVTGLTAKVELPLGVMSRTFPLLFVRPVLANEPSGTAITLACAAPATATMVMATMSTLSIFASFIVTIARFSKV